MEAIEWLELQAIKSGIRTRDEDLVLTLWDKRLSVALKEADPVKTVALMQGADRGFQGPARHDERGRRRQAPAQRRRDETRPRSAAQRDQHEMQTIDDVARYEAGLRDETRRSESFFSLQQLLQSLLKKAQSELDSPERDSARRVLRVVTMNAAERTGDKNYLALLEKYKLFTTGR
jgi:hypothetical protein